MKRVTLIVIFLVYSTIAWSQGKIDFWLRDAVKIYQEAKANALRNSASGIQIKLFKNQPIVDVILQTRDGNFSFLSNYGVTVRTVAGPYATVQLPVQAIDEIAAKENIVYICPHPKSKPLNDVALSITMVDSAISLGYTGKNVIMGVIDTGIDVTHPAFLDSAGGTRILYLWDQTVDGSGTSSSFYDFGKEWAKADIDAGLCTSVDTDGHGTHVAGSLAGFMINHVESIYHGGAIAANLIVVKGQNYTLDAINYIFEKARQLEKPAIINISLGSHYGPHDGSDPFIAARDFLTGPGRIIVQAAGNDGERPIHHMVDADADGESMNFTLQFSADSLLFELWHDGTQNVDMQIIGPAGVPNVVAPAGASGTVNSSNGNVTVDNASNGPENYNNDKRICVKLENNVAAGTWTFKLSTPSPTTVHAWMWNGDDDADFAFETTDNHYTLVNDACSRSSIVIGAYVSRTKVIDKDRTPQDWEDFLGPAGIVAKYSSGGPTRDGREKPDFVAPGGMVISAKSSNIPPAGQIYLDEFRSIGGRPDICGAFQNYGMMGTSQACPQADNVAAAILEEDRDQTPSQLIENMKKSTLRLDEKNNDRNIKSNENRFDNVNWHYRSGYGLVTLTGFLNNIPRVTVLKQTTDDIIEICYNKPLNNANNPSNYQIIGPSSGLKVVAAIQDNNSIKLFLDNKMIEGMRDSLRISNVEGFNEPVVMEIDKLGTLVQPDFILTNYVWSLFR